MSIHPHEWLQVECTGGRVGAEQAFQGESAAYISPRVYISSRSNEQIQTKTNTNTNKYKYKKVQVGEEVLSKHLRESRQPIFPHVYTNGCPDIQIQIQIQISKK